MDPLADLGWLQRIGEWADTLGYSSLGVRAALAVVLLLAFVLVSRAILALGRRVLRRLERDGAWYPPPLSIQRQEILSADDVGRVLGGVARAVTWLLVLVAALSFMQVMFGLFAWTETWAKAIERSVLEALAYVVGGVVDYLPNLVIIVVVVLVVRFFLRIVRLVFDGIATRRITLPGFYPEWAHTSFNLLRILVFALTLVVIFPYLPGAGSPAFQGLSIFFGVLLSLGSTSAVANVVAGIVLTYTRAFQLGDWVRIDTTEGAVVERSMFVTRLETRKNEVVSIPNASALSSHIVNFSAQARGRGLIVHTTVTIGYDVPWRAVHEMLLAAAASVEGIEAQPGPFVLQKSLDDFAVAYELNATTRHDHALPRIYSDLHQAIQDVFARHEVEIMSPMFVATRDGETSTVPRLADATPAAGA